MPALAPDPKTTGPAGAPPHIGIFDSGIGGLSVLRALQVQLPWARLSYIADSRHTPWGERPAAWVAERCGQLSAQLLAGGADLLVVACNTATTQAIAGLRKRWPAQRFVGIEPGIKPAVAASRNGRVALLATPGTLRSERLQHLVQAHAQGVTLLRLPCPGLAEAIEMAWQDDRDLSAQLDRIAARLRAAEVDTVVLGCTHYPLAAAALQQRLAPGTLLVDVAQAVARRVASLLPMAAPGAHEAPPPRLLATGPAQNLHLAALHWLGLELAVEALDLPDPLVPARCAVSADVSTPVGGFAGLDNLLLREDV